MHNQMLVQSCRTTEAAEGPSGGRRGGMGAPGLLPLRPNLITHCPLLGPHDYCFWALSRVHAVLQMGERCLHKIGLQAAMQCPILEFWMSP
jgi:hypothetical protein